MVDKVIESGAPPKSNWDLLTSQQRNVIYINRSLAKDLDRGTEGEQNSAAALHLVVDAVFNGYEADMVRVTREWQLAREREVVIVGITSELHEAIMTLVIEAEGDARLRLTAGRVRAWLDALATTDVGLRSGAEGAGDG